MRLIVKSRSQATAERLGGCGFPGCHAFAACSNCIQCVEHHALTTARGECGYDAPLPVKFLDPDSNLGLRTGVAMIVVDDNDPVLNGKPETSFSNATVQDLEELTHA